VMSTPVRRCTRATTDSVGRGVGGGTASNARHRPSLAVRPRFARKPTWRIRTKPERRKRLGLGRGADRLPDGQVRQEGIDLRLGHLGGVADIVENNEPLHSAAVGVFGAGAAVAGSQGLAQAVEEPGLPRLRLAHIGRSTGRACRCARWGNAPSVFSLLAGPGDGSSRGYSYRARRWKVNSIPGEEIPARSGNAARLLLPTTRRSH
jgi:hypothetical protein